MNIEDTYKDLSYYECVPFMRFYTDMIIPNNGDINKHIKNLERILKKEYGEDYEIIDFNEYEQTEVYTNLPYKIFLEHTYTREELEECGIDLNDFDLD